MTSHATTWFAAALLLGGVAACDGDSEAPASGKSYGGEEEWRPGPGGGMGPGLGMGPGAGRGAGMGSGQRAQRAEDCPIALAGTSVETEALEGGAAMVFTTEGDPEELEARVARMAEHHNLRHGPGGAPPGRGMGWGRPAEITPPPESTAGMVRSDRTVRFELRATDPSAADALRDHVEQAAAMMGQGRCPWMPAP